jgi:hypothetical protein
MATARAGTVELAVPMLRQGSYVPHWLLERRRRAEQALVSVVATAYLLGVSTRRVGVNTVPRGLTAGPRCYPAVEVRRSIADGETAYLHCYNLRGESLPELVAVIGLRWPVEECFEAAKPEQQVGPDNSHRRRPGTSLVDLETR